MKGRSPALFCGCLAPPAEKGPEAKTRSRDTGWWRASRNDQRGYNTDGLTLPGGSSG
jgi:hypothetical protein